MTKRLSLVTPALFTRISIFKVFSAILLTVLSTSSDLVMSQIKGINLSPYF
jgi:hypothetical protein